MPTPLDDAYLLCQALPALWQLVCLAMPAPLDDVCLFYDGRPAMLMPICAMPYLLNDAYLPYARLLIIPSCLEMPTPLLDDAYLLGQALPGLWRLVCLAMPAPLDDVCMVVLLWWYLSAREANHLVNND
jgi:hypothetical protein